MASIVPTADRSKGTVLVKVGFHKYDERVLPEMSAKVMFLKAGEAHTVSNDPPMLVIPETAYATRNGKTVVYKINDKKAVETTVEVGKKMNGYVEVVKGVEQGDKVINNLNEQIHDGISVNVE